MLTEDNLLSLYIVQTRHPSHSPQQTRRPPTPSRNWTPDIHCNHQKLPIKKQQKQYTQPRKAPQPKTTSNLSDSKSLSSTQERQAPPHPPGHHHRQQRHRPPGPTNQPQLQPIPAQMARNSTPHRPTPQNRTILSLKIIGYLMILTSITNMVIKSPPPPNNHKAHTKEHTNLGSPLVSDLYLLPDHLRDLYILDKITIHKLNFKYETGPLTGVVYYRSLITYYCSLFSSQPVITFNLPVPIGSFPFIYHLHLAKSLEDGDQLAPTSDIDHSRLQCDLSKIWGSFHEIYSTAFKVTFVKNGSNFQMKLKFIL